jgi:hypothetical protein
LVPRAIPSAVFSCHAFCTDPFAAHWFCFLRDQFFKVKSQNQRAAPITQKQKVHPRENGELPVKTSQS